ncbi:MAG: PAAR-like protein, partial [Fusobacteriaceae bacterium]
YIGNKSIIPKGTLCNKNLINGVPQMCSGYISTNEWEQGSKGITLNGSTVLLNNCKCTCKCGGTLSIVSSEGVAKAN